MQKVLPMEAPKWKPKREVSLQLGPNDMETSALQGVMEKCSRVIHFHTIRIYCLLCFVFWSGRLWRLRRVGFSHFSAYNGKSTSHYCEVGTRGINSLDPYHIRCSFITGYLPSLLPSLRLAKSYTVKKVGKT